MLFGGCVGVLLFAWGGREATSVMVAIPKIAFFILHDRLEKGIQNPFTLYCVLRIFYGRDFARDSILKLKPF